MILSDPLPLRDTSVWPGYTELQILPRVYGRARVAGVRYAEHNHLYVLADHALAGVDAVYDDGAPIAGWVHRNGADLTGHAAALLQLSAPPQGVLSADVRGLSGNPADILNDLYPRTDLQELAAQCANASLELGGVLRQRSTVRAAVQFVVSQFGGMWSAGRTGFAGFFPPADTDPIVATFGVLDVANAEAECQLSDLVTRLTVPFDWDFAADQAQQFLALWTDTALIHGERAGELALPWVKTARDALDIAARYLAWRARPLWTMTWTTGIQYRDVQPGSWISVDAGLPVAGLAVVTDIDPGYGRGDVRISAQAPTGLVPRVTLLQAGAAF